MLAYRHHIFERFLSSVHKYLFGATSDLDNTNFIEFRDSICKTNTKNCFNAFEIKDRRLKLTEEHSIESLKTILSASNKKNLPPRADYPGCAELMLILLGGIPQREIHWMKPGEVNHLYGCHPFNILQRCLLSVLKQNMTRK